MKIVLDTNVLISGVFWSGTPEKILEMAMNEKIQLYVTKEILDEYNRVLEKIGKKDKDLVTQWKMTLVKLVKIVSTDIKIDICRDPKDNMFLECSIASGSKYLVSGDDDLLTLKSIEKTKIITAKDFILIHGS